MSISSVAAQRFPSTFNALGTARSGWRQLGDQTRFYAKALAEIVEVVIHYRAELLRQVANDYSYTEFGKRAAQRLRAQR